VNILEQELHTKFLIFIGIVSILTIALYSSNKNFVSADTSDCFGDRSGLDAFICVYTGTTSNGEPYLDVQECVKDKDSKWDCHSLNKVNVPSGIKADIDASVKQEVQSNTNNTKDIGGLKNDTIPDLGTQERKAGEDQKEFNFPNKTILDTLK